MSEIIAYVIVIVLSSLYIATEVLFRKNCNQIKDSGQTFSGQIIGIQEKRRRGIKTGKSHVTVQFQTGAEMRQVESVHEVKTAKYQIGQTVSIVYDESRPDAILIAGENYSPNSKFYTYIILFSIMLLMAAYRLIALLFFR